MVRKPFRDKHNRQLLRGWFILRIVTLFFLPLDLSVSASVIAEELEPTIVHFPNDDKVLGGELYKPAGDGPFPAVLYNHGSAPGMSNSEASKAIAPHFVNQGWVFFMPYRRGQGLSSSAGPYIMEEITAARKAGGIGQGVSTMVKLLSGEHLADQQAGWQWLSSQSFVDKTRIAVVGNSFGGILSILGIEKISYCAAVDASGAAESWSKAPLLREQMIRSVRAAKGPILFFQAENDFDLTPSKVLYQEMQEASKIAEIIIYPPYGGSPREGHSFAYRGSGAWFPEIFRFLQKHCR